MRFAIYLLTLVFGLLFCGTAFAQTATPMANPSEALDTMIAAVAARDADAIAALYTDDALLLGSNSNALSGRKAIRDVWANNFSGGYSVLETGNPRTERGTDRAAVIFVWQATIRPNGAAETFIQGRTMLYFRLAEGGWLISADMWQPTP
ncbi:SgcJ/EcaC family oxidoreductase [Devosia rhodophyticola]|uniref:SgcJ/EcaC family oxidoreductase n=1 Tax=Devosia rhodophyticola TaxID=3026423 RepID=A0ABY7YX46_9HYPH|nr:SgcJ/EcaC family oxidoreductase [Devosia rhodophyticola]WDR05924.1 SgcJ/EcaC family oxidoreductase [Devosia rhodophyticola]